MADTPYEHEMALYRGNIGPSPPAERGNINLPDTPCNRATKKQQLDTPDMTCYSAESRKVIDDEIDRLICEIAKNKGEIDFRMGIIWSKGPTLGLEKLESIVTITSFFRKVLFDCLYVEDSNLKKMYYHLFDTIRDYEGKRLILLEEEKEKEKQKKLQKPKDFEECLTKEDFDNWHDFMFGKINLY